jgi:hypothetical protein
MKICFLAAISLASSAFMLTNASAFVVGEHAAQAIGNSVYLHLVGGSKNKTVKSEYCTTYDILSQSRIPCDPAKKPKPKKVTHTSKDYCTTYDIFSQTGIPCNSVKKSKPKKVTNTKADYCTTYDVVSQSRVPCNSAKKRQP